jgi:hypothetical protein
MPDYDVDDFRSGVIAVIVQPLEYAGKCESNNFRPQASEGKVFAEAFITEKVKRFHRSEREDIHRELLSVILSGVK